MTPGTGQADHTRPALVHHLWFVTEVLAEVRSIQRPGLLAFRQHVSAAFRSDAAAALAGLYRGDGARLWNCATSARSCTERDQPGAVQTTPGLVRWPSWRELWARPPWSFQRRGALPKQRSCER